MVDTRTNWPRSSQGWCDVITLTLPYPPSTNTYYRSLRKGPMAGRVLISEKGRNYREAVKRSVGFTHAAQNGRLSVGITLFPPDRRRRDVDNCLKALLDSLTHAGVWDDDNQIKKLSIEMTDRIEGKVEISIEVIQ